MAALGEPLAPFATGARQEERDAGVCFEGKIFDPFHRQNTQLVGRSRSADGIEPDACGVRTRMPVVDVHIELCCALLADMTQGDRLEIDVVYDEGRFDDDLLVRDHGIPDALLSGYALSADVVYELEINGGHAGELGIFAADVLQLQ